MAGVTSGMVDSTPAERDMLLPHCTRYLIPMLCRFIAAILFDLLPVALFLLSGLVIYSMYDSPLLLIGVCVTFVGGACKAIWKMIVVRKKRDVSGLTRAFHILMPAGFVLMIASVIAGGKEALLSLWRSVTMMPAAAMF